MFQSLREMGPITGIANACKSKTVFYSYPCDMRFFYRYN